MVAPTDRPSSPPPFDSDVIVALHLDFQCHSTRMSVLFAFNGVRFGIIQLWALMLRAVWIRLQQRENMRDMDLKEAKCTTVGGQWGRNVH